MTRLSGVAWWLLGSAAVLLIGALGPWAVVAAQPNVHGTHREGWFTLAAAVISAALVLGVARAGWPSRRPAGLVALLAALSVLVVAVDLTDVGAFAGSMAEASLIDTGWGIYVALLGAVALLAGALAALAFPPRALGRAGPAQERRAGPAAEPAE